MEPLGRVRGALGHFPGGTAISRIHIYDWPTVDGLRGGSPHVHLLCTEGYIVIGGTGRLQTLGPDGYVEVPLRPDEIVWFTPGVIHRAVNDGGLDILVVMQNAGLPEAGDAVMTLPPAFLTDAEAYAEQVRLSSPTRMAALDEEVARRRRDLAVEGFLALRERVEVEGPEAGLADFYAAARRLVEPRLPSWRERWESGPLAAAQESGRQLAALVDGDTGHLGAGGVFGLAAPTYDRYGMCGRLSAYDAEPERR